LTRPPRLKEVSHLHLGGQPVARVTDHATIQQVVHNQLGHLLGAFSEDGTGLDVAFVYGPFGEILAQAGASASYRQRFNGKDLDGLTQLTYYGFRYFDPLSLTWTQADPLYRFAPDVALDEPRRAGLYTFSLNNPLSYVDPTGLDGEGNANRTLSTKSDAFVMQSMMSFFACSGDTSCYRGWELDASWPTVFLGAGQGQGNANTPSGQTQMNAAPAAAAAVWLVRIWKAIKAARDAKKAKKAAEKAKNVAKKEAGKAARAEEQLSVTFGRNANQVEHAFRHTDKLGLSRDAVQSAIQNHLPAVADKIPNGAPLNQVIKVAGKKIQYSAFRLPNGSINVGRIHGVP
jgi:RHS repeat-associated protein